MQFLPSVLQLLSLLLLLSSVCPLLAATSSSSSSSSSARPSQLSSSSVPVAVSSQLNYYGSGYPNSNGVTLSDVVAADTVDCSAPFSIDSSVGPQQHLVDIGFSYDPTDSNYTSTYHVRAGLYNVINSTANTTFNQLAYSNAGQPYTFTTYNATLSSPSYIYTANNTAFASATAFDGILVTGRYYAACAVFDAVVPINYLSGGDNPHYTAQPHTFTLPGSFKPQIDQSGSAEIFVVTQTKQSSAVSSSSSAVTSSVSSVTVSSTSPHVSSSCQRDAPSQSSSSVAGKSSSSSSPHTGPVSSSSLSSSAAVTTTANRSSSSPSPAIHSSTAPATAVFSSSTARSSSSSAAVTSSAAAERPSSSSLSFTSSGAVNSTASSTSPLSSSVAPHLSSSSTSSIAPSSATVAYSSTASVSSTGLSATVGGCSYNGLLDPSMSAQLSFSITSPDYAALSADSQFASKLLSDLSSFFSDRFSSSFDLLTHSACASITAYTLSGRRLLAVHAFHTMQNPYTATVEMYVVNTSSASTEASALASALSAAGLIGRQSLSVVPAGQTIAVRIPCSHTTSVALGTECSSLTSSSSAPGASSSSASLSSGAVVGIVVAAAVGCAVLCCLLAALLWRSRHVGDSVSKSIQHQQPQQPTLSSPSSPTYVVGARYFLHSCTPPIQPGEISHPSAVFDVHEVNTPTVTEPPTPLAPVQHSPLNDEQQPHSVSVRADELEESEQSDAEVMLHYDAELRLAAVHLSSH